MKNIHLLFIITIFLNACTQSNDKLVAEETVITIDTIIETVAVQEAPTSPPVELLDVYAQFAQNKAAVALQLESLAPAQANALYESYYKENNLLLYQMMEQELDLLDQFYSDDFETADEVNQLGEKLMAYDLAFEEVGEGYIEIKTTPNFYYKMFNTAVTPDYKRYLYLKSEENKTLYQADAGLMISFEALGDRIAMWESFMASYPNSKLLKVVAAEVKRYQLDYLLGLDNTPSIERAQESYIYPENLAEFERFQAAYPESPTNELIDFLKENFESDEIGRLLMEKQE